MENIENNNFINGIDNTGTAPETGPKRFAHIGKDGTIKQMTRAEIAAAKVAELEAEAEAWSFLKTVPAANSPWSVSVSGVWYTLPPKDGKGSVSAPPTDPERPAKTEAEIEDELAAKATKIIGNALYIGGRVVDIDSGIESVELVWWQDKGWKKRIVPRRTVSETRAILALADDGLGVNSGNAAMIVKYIAYLLDQHQNDIPMSSVVSTTGWAKVGGQEVFVWGSEVIAAPGTDAPNIAFEPSSHDTRELTDAFRAAGTLEAWKSAMNRLGHLPTVTFGVMASLAAPFLTHFKLPQNPIIDYAGRSSSGKTTAAKVAASAWGFPPEMSGLIRSWNSTPVFIERMVSTCADLPSFLDESHVVPAKTLQSVTYQLANGTGKGRGAKDGGTQRTARFRSVVISCGESQLTSASQFDGATGRVIGYWGSPFGAGQADLVRSVTAAVMENHGHAGPAVIRKFLGEKTEALEMIFGWRDDFAKSMSSLVNDDIGERQRDVYAAIGAVGKYVAQALDLNWDVESLVMKAYESGTANRKTDNAQIALEDAVSHALAHPYRYEGSAQYLATVFHTDLEGRYTVSKDTKEVRLICFIPAALKTIFEARGHNYESTIAQWAERGWLLTDNEPGRTTRRVSFGGQKQRAIVLTEDAYRIAVGDHGQVAYLEEEAYVDEGQPKTAAEP